MERIFRLAFIIAVVVFLLAGSAEVQAKGPPSGEATLSGIVYCITADGKMHSKEGVCPADHIGHVMITDDGDVFMLGGEKLEEIVKAPLKAGAKVKIRGEVSSKLKSIDIKWWEEYETIGD